MVAGRDRFDDPCRSRAFAVAVLGAGALYLFLSRTFLGTAICAVGQDREIVGLMGVDQRRIYLITSGIGGALAGLATGLLVLLEPIGYCCCATRTSLARRAA
jgi:branched-chain amino acid transport system permease protein